MLNKMLVATAASAIFFSANAAFAQSGGGGGSPATLERLGCELGHVPRVNAAGEWECSVDLTAAEAAAAAAQSTADGAVLDAAAAQSTATTALGNAATAQSTAISAASAAAAAQSAADSAAGAAGAAQSIADEAINRVGILEGQNLGGRVSVLEAGIPPVPVPEPVLVVCPGDSINAALAAGAKDITVRGLCDEHVDIRTSNVTITGENLVGGAPVDGIDTDFGPGIGTFGILVSGAQNVNLIDLKITGGRNGATIQRNAAVLIRNAEIEPFDTSGLGVFVGDQSFLDLRHSDVTDGGMLLARGGVVRMQESTVTADSNGNKAIAALTIFAGSQANIFGATFEGSVIVNSSALLQVRSNFLANVFGPTIVDSTAGFAIICVNFSNVLQIAGSLVDASLVPLVAADVVVGDIAPGVPGCTLGNI